MTPIFMAIDTTDISTAKALVTAVDTVDIKVGLEYYLSNGLDGLVIRDIGRKRQLFLDLKFHDIPNTVASAVRAVLPIEPDFLTIHASDVDMMRAAVDAADECGNLNRPKLLGVTLLTSQPSNPSLVLQRAWDAYSTGMDGLVCSPLEVSLLRRQLSAEWPEMFLMVPGIRSAGVNTNDQQRTATPREAQDAGASALVIGREITKAADPAAVVAAIQASLKIN